MTNARDASPPVRRPLAITPAGIFGTLLLAAVVLVFLRLGFWQLARLEERRELNAGVAARLDAPPLEDPAALVDTTGLFYRAVTVHGTFDNDRSIVLPGRSRRGLPGVHLLTPLRVADRTEAVLVNRGWVPSPDAATVDLDVLAVRDTVTVTGLVLPFPGRSESLAPGERVQPSDGGFQRVWYAVDEPRLRAQFPYVLLPATLQELPSSAPAGAPRYPARLEPPPLDAGPHLGYALQWFSFAVVGIIGWIALVLAGRRPPRVGPPAGAAAVLLLGLAAPASAQLRPLDALQWRVFDEDTWLVADVGGGALWGQPATLAGVEGRLLEIGSYNVAFRSQRIAIELRGTALWHYREDGRTGPPAAGVQPAEAGLRREPGHAMAGTALQLSPPSWPVAFVVRFGATIPTTSDESGLERDRTDFYALAGARYRRGRLMLTTEHGVGINGTIYPDYPQSDVWNYAFGAAWQEGAVRAIAHVIGRQDGHSWAVRGNEDTRELHAGLDVGTRRWLGFRYVRGLSAYSPAHGLRLTAGLRLAQPGLLGDR